MEVDDAPSNSNAGIRIHEHFCASDAEITIQSSDYVRFLVHRKNLESITGAFPPSEFNTVEGEVVHLTEPALVLEIVFQFIYPQKPPSLDELEFDTVLAVAEAVEKYEVFSAMKTFEVRLGEFFPKHAEPVFLHAVKHDYRKLMDKAACHLLACHLVQGLKAITSIFLFAMDYHHAWHSAFGRVVQHVKWMHSRPDECNHRDFDEETGEEFIDICKICRAHILSWLSDLEGIDSLPELEQAASVLKPKYESDDGSNVSLCKTCKYRICTALYGVAEKLRKGFKDVPPLSHFLPGNK
ncbi:hypothetical protein CVT26_011183 [Gymnopilus dilepis]|uniref:BTB domain-containing protein n=1 Tax=Gymnopilus dilepis TaxID=231916 RepID=A0A409VJR4_9AGAR|nr:hypothetical protein CVT26_011183 [Gymnopilus dilepis]